MTTNPTVTLIQYTALMSRPRIHTYRTFYQRGPATYTQQTQEV